MDDARALLGLSAFGPVTEAVVRAAYKRAALKWHPVSNRVPSMCSCVLLLVWDVRVGLYF